MTDENFSPKHRKFLPPFFKKLLNSFFESQFSHYLKRFTWQILILLIAIIAFLTIFVFALKPDITTIAKQSSGKLTPVISQAVSASPGALASQSPSIAESSYANQQQVILAQLHAISKALKNRQTPDSNLAQMSAQVATLAQKVADLEQTARLANQAASQNASQFHALAQSNQAQNAALAKSLAKLSAQLSPIHYLPVRDLPFQVLSSGYWNHARVVTISMRDVSGAWHDRLMLPGQIFGCEHAHVIKACHAWRLVSISGHPATVIFESVNNQKHKVKVVLS